MVSLVELKMKCPFHPDLCLLEDSDGDIKGIWCPKCHMMGLDYLHKPMQGGVKK